MPGACKAVVRVMDWCAWRSGQRGRRCTAQYGVQLLRLQHASVQALSACAPTLWLRNVRHRAKLPALRCAAERRRTSCVRRRAVARRACFWRPGSAWRPHLRWPTPCAPRRPAWWPRCTRAALPCTSSPARHTPHACVTRCAVVAREVTGGRECGPAVPTSQEARSGKDARRCEEVTLACGASNTRHAAWRVPTWPGRAGDNWTTARIVAAGLGIRLVSAEVLPAGKADQVRLAPGCARRASPIFLVLRTLVPCN